MRQTAKNVSALSNAERNTYVIEHINQTFFSLFNEKSIDDISISELCNKAGVGRASFYRNFESKEAIIKSKVARIFREWISAYNKDENHPLSEQLGSLFSHFEEYNTFYKLLYERGLLSLLMDVILEHYGPKPESQIFDAYARAYFAYVLYGWIEVWFQRGMQDSAEEIEQLFKSQGL